MRGERERTKGDGKRVGSKGETKEAARVNLWTLVRATPRKKYILVLFRKNANGVSRC